MLCVVEVSKLCLDEMRGDAAWLRLGMYGCAGMASSSQGAHGGMPGAFVGPCGGACVWMMRMRVCVGVRGWPADGSLETCDRVG